MKSLSTKSYTFTVAKAYTAPKISQEFVLPALEAIEKRKQSLKAKQVRHFVSPTTA